MVNKCYIKDCRSRTERLKVSLFQGPGDRSEQKIWSQALGVEVSEIRHICELHFDPKDIVTHKKEVIDSGGKKHTEPLIAKKLIPGARPLQRNQSPPSKKLKVTGGAPHLIYHQTSRSLAQKSAPDTVISGSGDGASTSKENTHSVVAKIVAQHANEIPNVLHQPYVTPLAQEKDSQINQNEFSDGNRFNIKYQEISVQDVQNFENFVDNTSTIANQTLPKVEGEENTKFRIQSKDSTVAPDEKNLYDALWDAMGRLQFPSLSWVLSIPMGTKAIMFSLLDAMPSPSGSKNVVPIFQRQVFVHGDGRIQVRIFDKNIDLSEIKIESYDFQVQPKTVEEFEHFMTVIDESPVCVGGPSVDSYKNVQSESVYKDRIVWRHKKCPLLLDKGKICSHCLGIHKILSQNLTRQTVTESKFRIRLPVSPSKKSKIQQLRQKTKVVAQKLTRKEKKLQQIENELNQVHKRLQDLKENTLDSQIKTNAKNIPENQINSIAKTHNRITEVKQIALKRITLIKEIFAAGKKKNAKGRRYSDEWIILCLLLYIRSSAAYNFLRKNGILPLPCKTTIMKYLRASNVGCGFDDNFFKLFAERLDGLKDCARHGILSFDEMSVRSSIEVNTKDMTFEGMQNHGEEADKNAKLDKPADHALVFMFSSLSENFHQPIATFASKGPTSSNVLSAFVLLAIVNTEKAGGKVDGIVCDGATTNRSMWKELGICGKLDDCRFAFENPYEETRYVYAFSDAPHLIKCIRNRLQDKQVLKVNGQFVKWEYYKHLYHRDSQSDLRVCPKLTERHVAPAQSMKMRVSLATQIFSKSVSSGLAFYSKKEKESDESIKKFEGCEATIDFSLRINNMFDALNRSLPYEGIRKDSIDFEVMEQTIEWLNDWERNCENKEFMLTDNTTEGLRVTLHSTIQLTKYLLHECGFHYVLTRKMNQDCLEQFFGCIRQAGCQNDHPTLHTFKQLYHLLSIYQIVKPPKSGHCTVAESEAKKITLQDLKNIFPDVKGTYKFEHLKKLKEKLDECLVEYEEWDCEDVFDEEISLSETEDCVLYYISGFVARRLRKWTKCTDCKKAFVSSYENLISGLRAADLVNMKSEGGLIHPNIRVFELFKELEKLFQIHKNNVEVYHLVIEDFFASNYYFTFPCKEHKTEMTSNCIHYYLNMRMRQYSKIKNRDMKKKSQEIKKKSKYYSQ